MLINNTNVEIVELRSILELLKLNMSHYILEYQLSDEESLYYMVTDTPHYMILVYAYAPPIEYGFLKVDTINRRLVSCPSPESGAINIIKVKSDSFLKSVLKVILKNRKLKNESMPNQSSGPKLTGSET